MIPTRSCQCLRRCFSSSHRLRPTSTIQRATRTCSSTTAIGGAQLPNAKISEPSVPLPDAEAAKLNNNSSSKGTNGLLSLGRAKVVKLMSTNGCQWIDLTAESWSWDEIADDAKAKKVVKELPRNTRSFLIANRSTLLENGIAEEVFEKTLVDQWLPHTFAAEDRRTACLVLRVVASDEKEWKAVLSELSSEGTSAPDKVGMALSAANRGGSSPGSELQASSYLSARYSNGGNTPSDSVPATGSSSASSPPPPSAASTTKTARQRLATMGELTVRLDVFLNVQDRIVITVHRRPIAFIASLQNGWATKYRHDTMEAFLRRLVWHGLGTYRHSVFALASELDVLEALLFRHEDDDGHHPGSANFLPEQSRVDANEWTSQHVMQLIQVVNRRASAYTRVLRGFDRAYQKAKTLVVEHEKHVQLSPGAIRQKQHHEREIKLHVETVILLWDGLREQSQSLLSLHVSVAVSRLEELLRLLTVFSTVFIPLELVSSFFGMNFVGVCQVFGNDKLDFVFALLVMLATGIGTQRWINKKTTLYARRW